MCEVAEEKYTLESCLRLLRGEEDEKKIAGLLMAVKYLKPNTESGDSSENWHSTGVSIFKAVGIPFLDRLINTSYEGDYSASYPSVAFSFLINFCDISELQPEIAKLLTSILKRLQSSKEDGLRRDSLTILSSLSSNSKLLPLLTHRISLTYFLSYCIILAKEVPAKEPEPTKQSLLSDSLSFLQYLLQHSPNPVFSIILAFFQLTALCSPAFYYSLLPTCSSLLLAESFPDQLLQSNKQSLLLAYCQLLLRRCFTYKQTPANRIYIYNFIFAVFETVHFKWMPIDLSKQITFSIPSAESALSISKLLKVILKSSAIEIRVDLDFLYKDTIAAYNNVKKDRDTQTRDRALLSLIDCLHIVMAIMKTLAESADVENEMSCLDYDDVIDLSSGWAESLKCVKEFVHLAVDITKTDIYKKHYQSNQDFVTMNKALEYCSIFINMCLEEFPEEIDDDDMINDLVTWHETIQFTL